MALKSGQSAPCSPACQGPKRYRYGRGRGCWYALQLAHRYEVVSLVACRTRRQVYPAPFFHYLATQGHHLRVHPAHPRVQLPIHHMVRVRQYGSTATRAVLGFVGRGMPVYCNQAVRAVQGRVGLGNAIRPHGSMGLGRNALGRSNCCERAAKGVGKVEELGRGALHFKGSRGCRDRTCWAQAIEH